MSEDLEQLEILEEQKEEEVEDDNIQKTKSVKKKIYNVKPKDPDAPKKERTPAQKLAWEKALATRKANRDARLKEKQTMNEVIEEQKKISKKKVEDKIVKKAISIKKKQIKKEEVLDEISDDETSYEEIKKIAKAKPRPKAKPKYYEEEEEEEEYIAPKPRIRFV